MSHEDFFEATLIEFTYFEGKQEKTLQKYNNFEELPSHLIHNIKDKSLSEITLKDKNWKILEVNKDLRAHGKGMHIKVRLGPIPNCK